MFFSNKTNMGLYHLLKNKKAIPELSHDLMSLRAIGQQGFKGIVNSKFLNNTSTNAPTRKKRLCTLTIAKVQNSMLNNLKRRESCSNALLRDKLHGYQSGRSIFDNSGALPETPKELEQKQRDMKASDPDINHECCEFSDTAGIPEKWRGLLSCRQCKQRLTVYVADTMLNNAPLFWSDD